jgi:type I restriction enzyme S subunit
MNPERLLAHFETISEAPDAVARLRRFILDLAVRGKLVEQDPEDEPAGELLRLIEIQKRLTHGSKADIRVRHAFQGSLGSCPFEVPQGWTWVRLGDILLKLTDGTHHSPPNGPTGDFLYITAKNIKADGVSLRDITYVAKDIHEEIYARCNPERGDILYIKDGATTGVTAINDLTEPFSMLSSVALLKLPDCLFNALLLQFLRSPFFYDQMRGFMKGGAIPRVTLKRMAPALIPLPPLAEQHRIVAKVDELMALCDQLEAARQLREQQRERLVAASLQRLNQPVEDTASFRNDARFALQVLPSLTTTPAQIKQLRQTILNLAVRGKLVEQDPEDEPAEEQLERITLQKLSLARKERAFKKRKSDVSIESFQHHLPAGWVTATLADLVTILNGRAYKQSELLESGTPVLRVGNLFTSNKWYYSNLELEDDKYCDDGDLIFAWSASFGPFIWKGGRVIYHYHIWKLPLHSPGDLSRDYLHLYLLHKTAEIKSAGHGISMVHMTKEKMELLEVPLPPLAEQHRIVAKVDELMALCDQLEQQLSQADQQRRRLLEAVLAEALGG